MDEILCCLYVEKNLFYFFSSSLHSTQEEGGGENCWSIWSSRSETSKVSLTSLTSGSVASRGRVKEEKKNAERLEHSTFFLLLLLSRLQLNSLPPLESCFFLGGRGGPVSCLFSQEGGNGVYCWASTPPGEKRGKKKLRISLISPFSLLHTQTWNNVAQVSYI